MSSNTTEKVAKNFMRKAAQSRPATSGNKNVRATATRTGSPMPRNVTAPLKGPDKGTG